MNAGDTFYCKESIADTVKEFSDATVYYSDAILYLEDKDYCYFRRLTCDASKYQFVHQSCIYNKRLHSIHGPYVVSQGVTASDYLFFRTVPHRFWHKTETVISKYYVGDNISIGRRHDEQVCGVDLLLGSRSINRTFAVYWYASVMRYIRRVEKRLLAPNTYVVSRRYSKVRREEFWRDLIETPENS